jgi:hypothetical protein
VFCPPKVSPLRISGDKQRGASLGKERRVAGKDKDNEDKLKDELKKAGDSVKPSPALGKILNRAKGKGGKAGGKGGKKGRHRL